MYSIVSKKQVFDKQQLIRFLADADSDIVDIVDECAPGSTIEVLSEAPHTYIKTPSCYWLLYDGESDYNPPKNDVKISVPAAEVRVEATDAENAVERVGELQTGLMVYKTGLMKGTLHSRIVKRYSTIEPSHCFYVNLDTPAEAATYDVSVGNETVKSSVECDGWLMVRMENMAGKTEEDGSPAHTVTIKYNTGESFTFDTKNLVLEG